MSDEKDVEIAKLKAEIDLLIDENIGFSEAIDLKIKQLKEANDIISEMTRLYRSFKESSEGMINELTIERDQLRFHLNDLAIKSQAQLVSYEKLIRKMNEIGL